jgi:hypothetical protein
VCVGCFCRLFGYYKLVCERHVDRQGYRPTCPSFSPYKYSTWYFLLIVTVVLCGGLVNYFFLKSGVPVYGTKATSIDIGVAGVSRDNKPSKRCQKNSRKGENQLLAGKVPQQTR